MRLEGGPENCCGSTIYASDVHCEDSGAAPCIITPASAPTPTPGNAPTAPSSPTAAPAAAPVAGGCHRREFAFSVLSHN